MAGCYGNDPEDKFFERMLFRHLRDQFDPDELEKKMEEADYYHDLLREEKLLESLIEKDSKD